jgi:hypothetical protein
MLDDTGSLQDIALLGRMWNIFGLEAFAGQRKTVP